MIRTHDNSITTILKLELSRKIQQFILWDGFLIVGTDQGEVMAWRVDCDGPI